VVVATPPETHARLALEALRAGKDVLVEKPMALTVADGERLQETAEGLGRVLMVGHVLEYHPAVRKLQELVDEGAFGRILYVYSNRVNLGRIRAGSNALWSFAPHDVALTLRLVRSMPEDVTSHGGTFVTAGLADVTLTSLRFPNGVRGHLFVSWLHPFREQRFVVVGEQQMAVFDDTRPWPDKLTCYSHRVDGVNTQMPVTQRADARPVPLQEMEPLRAECEHFLHCVRTRQRPLTDGASGVRVLRVLEAAQRSLEEGGQAVRVAHESVRVLPYEAHPTASIDAGAEIGAGTRVWHYSHVMSEARIGRNCVLGQNVFIGRRVRIGNGVKIQNNVSVYEGVEIEDAVFCGPSVVFTNVKNPRSAIERKHEFRPTLVRQGATLGANCTILCDVTIGWHAFVGAGAVVTRNVPDYALVVGSPARIAGWVCECAEPLHFEGDRTTCGRCGQRYRRIGEDKIDLDER
jgi:UDP-2-acetamido-3-amino-2,3-dideoxy-glucuronate N-acetyltransferase